MRAAVHVQRVPLPTRTEQSGDHLTVMLHHDEWVCPDERRVSRGHNLSSDERVRLWCGHPHVTSVSVEAQREEILPPDVIP